MGSPASCLPSSSIALRPSSPAIPITVPDLDPWAEEKVKVCSAYSPCFCLIAPLPFTLARVPTQGRRARDGTGEEHAGSMRMAPIHRSPERTVRSILSGILLLGLLSTFPLAVAAEDDLSREEAQKKLDEATQKLQSSRALEEGLSQDIAALAEARAKLNTELIEAGKRVQASEAKLSETEAKLTELTDQVTVIRNSITDRKETIVKMLSAMQRIGRTPPPALVTRRDDALAVVRSAMLLAQVFPELKYQADN